MQDFVKAVAYNLFAFMQSFGAVQALGGDKLLNQWFEVSRAARQTRVLLGSRDCLPAMTAWQHTSFSCCAGCRFVRCHGLPVHNLPALQLHPLLQKTMDRLRRDPDFLTRRKDAI